MRVNTKGAFGEGVGAVSDHPPFIWIAGKLGHSQSKIVSIPSSKSERVLAVARDLEMGLYVRQNRGFVREHSFHKCDRESLLQ